MICCIIVSFIHAVIVEEKSGQAPTDFQGKCFIVEYLFSKGKFIGLIIEGGRLGYAH